MESTRPSSQFAVAHGDAVAQGLLAPRMSSVGGQALDTARDDRLKQALDPLEIPIAGHMQRI